MPVKETNWAEWKCRCSSISKILSNSKENPPITDLQLKELEELDKKPNRTDKQGIRLAELVQKRENSKVVVLSDTCIAYLLEAFAWETEKMVSITKELDVEAFERGRKTEPESIQLLNNVDKTTYFKNDARFENAFLSGIPDVLDLWQYSEAAPISVIKIREIKSTRDYPMFLYKIHKGLDPGNKEQIQGYGDILDCGDLAIVFTLPNMPEEQRLKYKYKLADRMGEATTESPRFLKTWKDIEHSMVFDSIPDPKRTFKIPVGTFVHSEQQAVYERVKHCREWLNNFHQQYLKLNQ